MAIFSAMGEYYNNDNVQSNKELKTLWKLLRKTISKHIIRSGSDVVRVRIMNPYIEDIGGAVISGETGDPFIDYDKKKNEFSGFIPSFKINSPKTGYSYNAEKIDLKLKDPIIGPFNEFRNTIISGDDEFKIQGPRAVLDGGEGDDYFDLLVDYAKVRGGNGNDQFYFRPDRGKKGVLLITDFSAEKDAIQIDPVDASRLKIQPLSNNTILKIGNDTEIIFKNRKLVIDDINIVFD